MLRLDSSTFDHVQKSSWSSNDDLDSGTQSIHIVPDVGTAHASEAGDLHVISESDDYFMGLQRQLTSGSKNNSLGSLDLGVNSLQDGYREGGGLPGTGLSLSDDIVLLDYRYDSPLLDSRRTLKTGVMDIGMSKVCVNEKKKGFCSPVSVDPAQKRWVQIHIIETGTTLKAA